MLNFDPDRYLSIQKGAVALEPQLRRLVAERLSGGTENLFFVGTGGVAALMDVAARLLQTRSTLPVFVERAAEIVNLRHVGLGPASLVIMPSLSGTTPETLAALEHCQAHGAHVLALAGDEASPLARKADATLVNQAADDTSCESFYLQSLLVALVVLDHRHEIDDYAQLVDDLIMLPWELLKVKSQAESHAEHIAQALAGEPFHIIVGAGSTWPEAWYYGTCILEEMQWIRTRPVHASDFFHGTLELVEDGVSVVLLKGEDASRDLVERVERFLPFYTKSVIVMDAAEFSLAGISPATRALISPVVIAAALERVSAHLEVIRDHPLTTRRYYRQVAY